MSNHYSQPKMHTLFQPKPRICFSLVGTFPKSDEAQNQHAPSTFTIKQRFLKLHPIDFDFPHSFYICGRLAQVTHHTHLLSATCLLSVSLSSFRSKMGKKKDVFPSCLSHVNQIEKASLMCPFHCKH